MRISDWSSDVCSSDLADARFVKPLDEELVRRLAREHEVLVTVAEGAIRGFAAQVLQFLAREGIFDKGLNFRPMTLPDRFIDHEKPEVQIAQAGLDRARILATVLEALGQSSEEHTTELQSLMRLSYDVF